MTERRQFVGHRSTAEAEQFTGLSREITVDMQAETLRVHDGNTKGGYPLMRADMGNATPDAISTAMRDYEKKSNKVSLINDSETNVNLYPSVIAVVRRLTTKANIDLDNLSETGINNLTSLIKSLGISDTVETSNGTAIKLGNGYCIQFGKYTSGNNGTVNLPIEMADSGYTVITTINYSFSFAAFSNSVNSQATDKFTIQTYAYENSHTYWGDVDTFWLVLGKYKTEEEE